VGIAISGMIIHIDLPIKFDHLLGSQIPDSILDRIEDDPLHIYSLNQDLRQYIPPLVETYADTLRWVFLIFVPLSALSVVVVVFLPEYKLDRSLDGEPIKRDISSCHPLHIMSVFRRLCGIKPQTISPAA